MYNVVQKIYADTSVFGGAFNKEFSNASQKLLEQIRLGRFHLILSPIVDKEIRNAPEEVLKIYQSSFEYAEMLPLKKETIHLQEAYLEARIVSPK